MRSIPTIIFLVTAGALYVLYLFLVAFPAGADSSHWLEFYMVASGGAFLFGGMLWLVFAFYLMYRFLHQVDKVVDPTTYELIQRRGDELFHRVHRLLFYSGSATARWFNRRLCPEYDFRNLPFDLRLPLVVHFYWLWLVVFFMVTGFLAMETLESWGMREPV